MPRSSRGSRSSAPRAAPAQTRSASSAAAPAPVAQPAPVPHPTAAQSSGGGGMFAQMAATAGSVAAGSVIGHGVSNMLFGGRSNEAAAPASQQTAAPAASSCEIQAKEFTKCLDAADVQTCSWFLEQLKACQAAAKQY